MSRWPLRRRRAGPSWRDSWHPSLKTVKNFRRSQEDISGASEKAGERTIGFKTSRPKTGCRALRVRATSGANAPERARQETSTHTVYDRHSIKETGKRSRITPSRPHDLQRAFESTESRSHS